MGWYEDLTNSQQKEDGAPVLQLATIDGATPRARTLLQRGFIAASAYPARPLILSSTDIRTPKVAQITAQDQVELVYWAPHTLSQFRIQGRAAIVPAPEHSDGLTLPTDGVFGALQREGYDWERQRIAVFNAMSARMKATWCWPTSGTPLADAPDRATWPKTLPKLGEGTPEEARLLAVSLGRFALVAVEPDHVDHVDFRVEPAGRTRYRWDEGSGAFEATPVAP